MILRKLAQAIQRQDWFQVVIEVMIVIVGIFLGLQVQAWYDGRAAIQEEVRTIDYFIADLEKNSATLRERDLFMENQIAKGEFVLKTLEGDSLRKEDGEDFRYGIFVAGFTEPLDSFLNSLNGENLENIRNDRLRRILDNFVGYVNRSTTVTLNIKSNIQTSLPYINSKSSFSRTSDGVITAIYDFEDLKNDQKYKALFLNIHGKTRNYRINLLKMIEESQKLINVLKDYQAGEALPEVEFQ